MKVAVNNIVFLDHVIYNNDGDVVLMIPGTEIAAVIAEAEANKKELEAYYRESLEEDSEIDWEAEFLADAIS